MASKANSKERTPCTFEPLIESSVLSAHYVSKHVGPDGKVNHFMNTKAAERYLSKMGLRNSKKEAKQALLQVADALATKLVRASMARTIGRNRKTITQGDVRRGTESIGWVPVPKSDV